MPVRVSLAALSSYVVGVDGLSGQRDDTEDLIEIECIEFSTDGGKNTATPMTSSNRSLCRDTGYRQLAISFTIAQQPETHLPGQSKNAPGIKTFPTVFSENPLYGDGERMSEFRKMPWGKSSKTKSTLLA